jgi:hypothetical protein
MSLANDLKIQRLKGYQSKRLSRKKIFKSNAKSIMKYLVFITFIILIIYSITSKDVVNFLQSIFKPEPKIVINR